MDTRQINRDPADNGPHPTSFRARTAKKYVVPFTNPAPRLQPNEVVDAEVTIVPPLAAVYA